jgi:hypothetical protein
MAPIPAFVPTMAEYTPFQSDEEITIKDVHRFGCAFQLSESFRDGII